MSAKQAIHDKLQGSIATYVFKFKVWYNHDEEHDDIVTRSTATEQEA